MIVQDQRLGHFVILYDSLTHIVFHTQGELWLELRVAEGKQNLFPANILCEGTVLYLKVNNAFITDKFKAFKALNLSVMKALFTFR